MTYHVVCHDCDFEDVLDTEEAAELGTYLHREDTGHDVEYGQLD